MPGDPSLPAAPALFSLDPFVVDQLACPACLGALRVEAGSLVCAACGRSYPVVDGIPVLIVERAIDTRA